MLIYANICLSCHWWVVSHGQCVCERGRGAIHVSHHGVLQIFAVFWLVFVILGVDGITCPSM